MYKLSDRFDLMSLDELAEEIHRNCVRIYSDFHNIEELVNDPITIDIVKNSGIINLPHLSDCLKHWINTERTDLHEGELILAWANLAVLTELAAKIFLAIYRTDLQNTIAQAKSDQLSAEEKNSITEAVAKLNTADRLQKFGFFELCSIVKYTSVLGDGAAPFMDGIRKRRNLVLHTGSTGEIRVDHSEFVFFAKQFAVFINEVYLTLPDARV